jgi:hypothetical protein
MTGEMNTIETPKLFNDYINGQNMGRNRHLCEEQEDRFSECSEKSSKHYRHKLSQCLYEVKYYINNETNRRNRVLVCKFDNCGREFAKTWGLKEHYRVHSKEKPFSCSHCRTRFTQKGSLLKHIKKNSSRGYLIC